MSELALSKRHADATRFYVWKSNRCWLHTSKRAIFLKSLLLERRLGCLWRIADIWRPVSRLITIRFFRCSALEEWVRFTWSGTLRWAGVLQLSYCPRVFLRTGIAYVASSRRRAPPQHSTIRT